MKQTGRTQSQAVGRGAGGASGTELIQQNKWDDGVYGEEQDPMSSQDGALIGPVGPFLVSPC